jgi:hypothetical protein
VPLHNIDWEVYAAEVPTRFRRIQFVPVLAAGVQRVN